MVRLSDLGRRVRSGLRLFVVEVIVLVVVVAFAVAVAIVVLAIF